MTLHCVGIALIVVDMTCTEVAPPPPAVVCPPVRAWSQQFQKRVAAEVRAAPTGALAEVARQAVESRDVARACRAAKRR